MPLSAKKKAKLAHAERVRLINFRSLNGKGWFMDAAHEADAKQYIETGDKKFLRHLPDYSERRRALR